MSLRDKNRDIQQNNNQVNLSSAMAAGYHNSSSTPLASSKVYTSVIKNSNDSAYQSFNETDNMDKHGRHLNKFRFLEFSPSSSSSNSMYQCGVTAYNLTNNFINGQYNNTYNY
jgi:hypothetical protein